MHKKFLLSDKNIEVKSAQFIMQDFLSVRRASNSRNIQTKWVHVVRMSLCFSDLLLKIGFGMLIFDREIDKDENHEKLNKIEFFRAISPNFFCFEFWMSILF